MATVPWTSDWREVVAAKHCDAVIVATPPEQHAEVLEACLDANRPCIVEKPLCLDATRATQLVARADMTATPVLVDNTHLFSPAYSALKNQLGAAGDSVRFVTSEGMAHGPFRADTPALWDWASHDVAICLDLFGRLPSDVTALGAGPWNAHDLPELAAIRLDYDEDRAAWIVAGNLGVTRRRVLAVYTASRLFVIDDNAENKLRVAPFELTRRYVRDEQLEWQALDYDRESTAMQTMLRYFVAGLDGGDRARFGLDLAADAVRILARCAADIALPKIPRA